MKSKWRSLLDFCQQYLCFLVFTEAQIEELKQGSYNYNEEDVRKLITMTLTKNRQVSEALKKAAISNLPE